MKKLVTVIAAVGIIGVGGFLFKDNVSVSPIETQNIVHPSEDVVNQFGQLRVNGFTWISEDVHWLGNETIEFNGKRTTEESVFYNFDTNTLEIDEVEEEKHLDNELILYEDFERLLYTDRVNDGLYLKANEDVTELLSDQKFSTSSEFVLSKDVIKIGYLNKEKKQYVTYDTSSGRTSNMAYKKGNFETLKASDIISFSDDGGFISFEDKTELFQDNRFSVLGADSGRYYGKAIKGMNPKFSTDSKTLAFVYTGALEQDYSGAKIGVFVLKYKNIVYLDSLLPTEILYPELAWSENGKKIFAVTKDENEQYVLSGFDVSNGQRNGLALPEGIIISKVKELRLLNNSAYIVYDNGKLIVLDLENGRYNSYEGLKPLSNKEYFRQISETEFIVYTDSELWSVSKSGHNVLMEYDGLVRGVYLSKDNEKVAVLLDDEGQFHLQISGIRNRL